MPVLPTPAIASQNTLLYLGTDASPSVFSAAIDRLGNIKFSNKRDVVDVSNQTSHSRRKLATLLDNGALTADYYFEPTQSQDEDLFALYQAAPAVLRSWRCTFPDGQNWLFAGWLTKFTPDASIGGALKCAFEVTIDGDITVT